MLKLAKSRFSFLTPALGPCGRFFNFREVYANLNGPFVDFVHEFIRFSPLCLLSSTARWRREARENRARADDAQEYEDDEKPLQLGSSL